MKRDFRLYIKDIVNAMESIESFVEDIDLNQLKGDDKTSSAVIRKFEIIGEAVKFLPDEIKDKYSKIPWKGMAGMRDILIHAYFGIDYKIVWDTIRTDIPKLKPLFIKILEQTQE